MADNTTLNPGVGGDVIATDDVSGVKYQIIKIATGAADAATLIGAANPLPCDTELPAAAALSDAVANPTAPTVGAALLCYNGTTFDRVRGDTSNGVDVDVTRLPALPAGSNNIGDVDVLTVPAPLNVVGNGAAATALRVTMANDSTGIVAATVSQATASNLNAEVQGDAAHDAGVSGNPVLMGAYASAAAPTNVSGDADAVRLWALRSGAMCTQVTAAGALIGGDASNGLDVDVTRLPALAAGTNNIGDVDVLTVPAPLSTTGGGTEATALRVTVASDSTGVLSVDDNGGSLTVDGTVTTAGAAAHDAAVSGNPTRVAGRAATSDYTAVAAGDTADILTSLTGKQIVLPKALPGQTWNYAAASGGITNTTGVTAKAAAGAGVRNYITHVDVVNGHATASTDVQIRDGASGTVLWRGFAQAAGGGVSADFDPPLRGTANTLVEVACGTTGTATYFNLVGFTAAE